MSADENTVFIRRSKTLFLHSVWIFLLIFAGYLIWDIPDAILDCERGYCNLKKMVVTAGNGWVGYGIAGLVVSFSMLFAVEPLRLLFGKKVALRIGDGVLHIHRAFATADIPGQNIIIARVKGSGRSEILQIMINDTRYIPWQKRIFGERKIRIFLNLLDLKQPLDKYKLSADIIKLNPQNH